MRSRQRLGQVVRLVGCLALAMVAASGLADPVADDAGVRVAPVLATALAETADRHASMVVVTLDPGAESDPHRHPGTVLVYVLEGVVESALDDGVPQTYSAGQAWTETPDVLHRVARNNTKNVAKLLAVLIHGDGDGLQLPAEPHDH